ncbi:hypothetical protein [Sphaerotilus mobilis]|uniref:hypothetical protein n=1 Tax=Sphaerotilus mobilis TaxID=47994 RepID=UPI00102CA1DC|nr:hypothetical protein [Sphaerotilus mobilis]
MHHVIIMIAMILVSGCSSVPYRAEGIVTNHTNSKPKDRESFKIANVAVNSTRVDYKDAGALLSSLTVPAADPKDDRRRLDVDAGLNRSLDWLGYSNIGPNQRAEPYYLIHATFDSTTNFFTAQEPIYEERDTGSWQSHCFETFLGTSCTNTPIMNRVRVGTRDVPRQYQSTTLRVDFTHKGEVVRTVSITTTDTSCNVDKRLQILAGEGFRQVMKNSPKKTSSISIESGFCYQR